MIFIINYSKPRFVSVEDILAMQSVDKNKTTAFCQCPLPLGIVIDGVEGGYYHVVEYNKTYTCKDCGTVFSVERYSDWTDIKKGEKK